MKRLNSLVLAFALLIGLSLTSCLNSDPDPTSYATPVVKVHTSYLGMGVYFETMDGLRIEPTESSYNSTLAQGINWNSYNGQVVQLVYSYDTTSPDVTIDDTGIYGVTLISLVPMNSAVEVVRAEGAPNDSIGNMPIIAIGEDNYNGEPIETQYWDATTLLMPINYYISNVTHTFTLEYHPYEEAPADGSLRLYLEHNKQSDRPTTQYTSWNQALYGNTYLYYRAFDLSPISNYLMSAEGRQMPTKLTIVAREDEYNLELTDSTPTKEYVVEYSEAEK